ncbi:MAG: sigma-70 family RNA polymerase sigma factor [Pirellulaceae bacterium]|jgi:RNA polymerase sigma-70 factor (ECF subfamily)|nr:sigma-70 family RNA polymerase sigma factor [Pirellulaceae bacterium]
MSTLLQTRPISTVSKAPRFEQTDEELLLDYRVTKDRETFTELVGRYEQELYSYLRRYLGSAELAEDAFQSAFLQVHLKCDQFEEGRRFKPWLYAIATNQAIDVQRKDRRHRVLSLDGLAGQAQAGRERTLMDLMVSQQAEPGTRAHEDERNEALKGAIDQLSDQMRTVVHLVYYQGMKYREAAEVMRVPVGTVKSRLHTAVAKLTEFWKRHHPDLD